MHEPPQRRQREGERRECEQVRTLEQHREHEEVHANVDVVGGQPASERERDAALQRVEDASEPDRRDHRYDARQACQSHHDESFRQEAEHRTGGDADRRRPAEAPARLSNEHPRQHPADETDGRLGEVHHAGRAPEQDQTE
jgi:hypothetical protein